MVRTPEVEVLVRPEAKVRCMAMSQEGTLAWVEGQRNVFFASLDELGTLTPLGSAEHQHPVTYIGFFDGKLIVGDDLDGFTLYADTGEILEVVGVDGGIVDACVLHEEVCFLGGMGSLLTWKPHQPPNNLSEALGLKEVMSLVAHHHRLYVAMQDGEVLSIEDQLVAWRRPPRGVHGERITALGVTQSGGLFLTREGHALVAGDEEAIEFEFWIDETLVARKDISGRMLTSTPCAEGAVVGFDDGSVMHLAEDGTLEQVMDTQHPVAACLAVGEHTLASSWFYIHGTNGEQKWTVEHQGMPALMLVRPSSTGVVFAGDDQNDYTSAEPIGYFSLEGPYREVDRAELNLWFQVSDARELPSAEAIYGTDDDVLEHLTADEREVYLSASGNEGNVDVLLNAMGTPEAGPEDTMEAGTLADEEALMEQLSGLGDMAMEEQNDLFEALNETLHAVHRPQAVAGEDRQLTADADGTAVVHLDGRSTHDPHGMILRWTWHNERGEELAEGPQLKLRLPLGNHRFELRVVDQNGSWTTDSVAIEVIETSTS
ncbi:MAG: hypothetical protein ACO3L7_01995 [Poseidonia sp.]